MTRPAKIDSMATRTMKLTLGIKVRCAYPGCRREFEPRGSARGAYAKKGYCYCHEHEARVALRILQKKNGNNGRSRRGVRGRWNHKGRDDDRLGW
jgi:hypothetical protein